MDDLVGTWVNETDAMGVTITTTQTFRSDGSYETRMVFALPGGGQQTVIHEGELDVGPESFRARFSEGRTSVAGAAAPAMNHPERPFTEAERAQTLGLLEQSFPYSVDGDVLTTTAQSPAGEMTVVYHRV